MLNKVRSKCKASLIFKRFELLKIGLFAHSISQDVKCEIFKDLGQAIFLITSSQIVGAELKE